MANYLIIFLGGGLGAIARFVFSRSISGNFGSSIPMGTLFVNVTGSFLIGFFFRLLDLAVLPPIYRSLVTVGFIGAYTTFSTYAFETITLIQRKEYLPAVWNFLLNNALSLGAVLLGLLAASALFSFLKGGTHAF
jgi:CrcB protein